MAEKNKIPEKYIQRAIEDKKAEYFCKKHDRKHRYGTKIWKEDIYKANINRVSEEVKREAKKLFRIGKREGKAWYLEEGKKTQNIMNAAIKKTKINLDKGIYFVYELMYFYEGRNPELRIVGRTGGYSSISEAMEDHYVASNIKNAKKSKESTIFITKAALIKIIGA